MPLLPGVQFSDCLTTSFLEMTVNFGDIHKRIMVKASKNPISYMWWQSSCGYICCLGLRLAGLGHPPHFESLGGVQGATSLHEVQKNVVCGWGYHYGHSVAETASWLERMHSFNLTHPTRSVEYQSPSFTSKFHSPETPS